VPPVLGEVIGNAIIGCFNQNLRTVRTA
jgi:hypothetical protein